MKKLVKYIFRWLPVLALLSCEKSDADLSAIPDQNTIALLTADNFNLKFIDAVITRGGFRPTLQEAGPFTLLAPSDQAFNNAGFTGTGSILAMAPGEVSQLVTYHTLEGRYEFNTLPFRFNQEVESWNGKKMYVTHWVKGQDTVLTINGARITTQNIPASNGLVQVIDQVLESYTHERLLDALAAERNLTLFYQAVVRSGISTTLSGADLYTVYAPTNTAMQQQNGFQTIEQINERTPEEMATLVRRHIVSDRRFVYDYILTTGASNASNQTMLDGNSIAVKLVPNPNVPGSFNGISLRGLGNTADITLARRDILTGNGVLHVINGILRTN